jgi:hypothetical protein
LINNILKKYNYFDKKLFQIPTLSITNHSTFLEYKYSDILNKEDYFINISKNDNLTEIIINSELVAIITQNDYDRILTFINNYENKEIKMFYYYLINLVLYNYNNNPLVQDDPYCNNITFNIFENKVYDRI